MQNIEQVGLTQLMEDGLILKEHMLRLIQVGGLHSPNFLMVASMQFRTGQPN
jgi:hypothetical protein